MLPLPQNVQKQQDLQRQRGDGGGGGLPGAGGRDQKLMASGYQVSFGGDGNIPKSHYRDGYATSQIYDKPLDRTLKMNKFHSM